MDDGKDAQGEPTPRFLVAVAMLLYALAVLRTAWLSDDAFITFRAVDNLVHGYGLVQNPPERVLGFTNGLWGLLFIPVLGARVNAYAAGIGMSVGFALLGAWFVARRASQRALGALGVSWLALSPGYVDFSTSGLENPLSHLLLALLYGRMIGKVRGGPSVTPFLLLGLIVMTRSDHVFIAAPAVIREVLQSRDAGAPRPLKGLAKAWLRPALLGLSPFIAWTFFVIVYYGFPFPNSAYAKLNATIPTGTFIAHGAWYLVDTVMRDPLAMLVIALAIFTGVRSWTGPGIASAAGIALHLGYVVRVGGDFMAGRFLTAPFLVSVVWLAGAGLARIRLPECAALGLVTTLIGWPFATAFFSKVPPHGELTPSGILSERTFYAEFTGLEHNVGASRYRAHGFWIEGDLYRNRHERVVTRPNVGFAGYAAGPDVHILDDLAVTDPLLARIPYGDLMHFRAGHFARPVPPGYVDTLRSGTNQIKDPCLRQYYDVLTKVTRGPLFSVDRWKAIFALNFGRYDGYVRGNCPR